MRCVGVGATGDPVGLEQLDVELLAVVEVGGHARVGAGAAFGEVGEDVVEREDDPPRMGSQQQLGTAEVAGDDEDEDGHADADHGVEGTVEEDRLGVHARHRQRDEQGQRGEEDDGEGVVARHEHLDDELQGHDRRDDAPMARVHAEEEGEDEQPRGGADGALERALQLDRARPTGVDDEHGEGGRPVGVRVVQGERDAASEDRGCCDPGRDEQVLARPAQRLTE